MSSRNENAGFKPAAAHMNYYPLGSVICAKSNCFWQHPNLAMCLNIASVTTACNLTDLRPFDSPHPLIFQEGYNEAELCSDRAIAIGKKTLGPTHPKLAIWLATRAKLYEVQVKGALFRSSCLNAGRGSMFRVSRHFPEPIPYSSIEPRARWFQMLKSSPRAVHKPISRCSHSLQ